MMIIADVRGLGLFAVLEMGDYRQRIIGASVPQAAAVAESNGAQWPWIAESASRCGAIWSS